MNLKKLNSSSTFREAYNYVYSFPKDTSHSLEEISSTTRIDLDILQDIFNRGVGAWKTNPTSVRSNKGQKRKRGFSESNRMSKEQWAYARIYGFVMFNPKQVADGQPDNDLYRKSQSKGVKLTGGGRQFFCRVGSKLLFLDKILPLIPPHKKYVEAFVGGGAVYWNKEPADKAVLNDLDKDLIEGYKLLKSMKNKLPSDFPIQVGINKIQKLVDKQNPTREERLLQKLYTFCNTFSSKGIGKIYQNNSQRTKINRIKDFVDRMKNTTLTNQDYVKVLKQHDSPSTFFFLDPPYEEKSDTVYIDFFIDYEEMNKVLKSLRGKFLLTINDSPKIRSIFKGFIMKSVVVKGRTNKDVGVKDRKELFIMNY